MSFGVERKAQLPVGIKGPIAAANVPFAVELIVRVDRIAVIEMRKHGFAVSADGGYLRVEQVISRPLHMRLAKKDAL